MLGTAHGGRTDSYPGLPGCPGKLAAYDPLGPPEASTWVGPGAHSGACARAHWGAPRKETPPPPRWLSVDWGTLPLARVPVPLLRSVNSTLSL